ncbi:Hypothetical_protein [Hexamita inflata]|uniref:Hypothetical_protein n=1 Tax=Hexamita inflata TaxID=28002 RepID=A0AA86QIX5_9EUKA|nr:Hypothetical protein HINF_LOCUS46813 [Hexamita inflata]
MFNYSILGISMVGILYFYFYQERDQNSCIVESVILKINQKKLENLFTKHFSQYISEMGEQGNLKINTICASIRINFNPKIDQLVQFSRFVEQLCNEYQVKIVTASSKQLQFFVSEEIASIQKKFDITLQLCSGAQMIARNLNLSISAGIAFGEIYQIKQIFGSLQYNLYHGNVLEITDFVSQHSFDEILVDATSLYKDMKHIAEVYINDSKYQHFQEPNFKYVSDVREIKHFQDILIIAVAEPMKNMNKQILQVLMKNNQVAEATLDFHDIASSDHPSDNKFQSDSQTVSVLVEKSKNQNVHPMLNETINFIHVILEKSQQIVCEENQTLRQKFNQKVIFIRQTLKSTSFNSNLKQNILQNLSRISSYYLASVVSIFLLVQYNILFSQIGNNSIYIHDKITLQTWLSNQQYLFICVIVVQMLCLVPYLVFNLITKINHIIMKKMKSVDLVIQKLLFVTTIIWYITILYGFQTMLHIVKNYNHLKQVSKNAQTILWTITIYIAHNFNQTISVSSQHPLQISLNFKVFIMIELIHWLMVFQEYPAMALMMIFVQIEQLPVQVYKYFVAVENIHIINTIKLYLKKQASILSRHRIPLQVNSELLLHISSHSILQHDIAGDLMVKYEKLQLFTESNHEDKAFIACLNQKVKNQLQQVPVMHINDCIIFQTEFEFDSVENTNEILAELFEIFGDRIQILRTSRISITWISQSNKDLYSHVKIILSGLFLVLQKYSNVGVKLSVGDLKGIALCYENVFCEMIGEAADEIRYFNSSQGKVKVSKKFWEWFVLKQKQSSQPLKFQKKYIDYGIQVELWK